MFDIRQILSTPVPQFKVVDVGAMFLGADNDVYAPLLKAFPTRVVGFEPVEAECKKLQALYGGERVFLPHVIGDGTEREFRVCNEAMTSSLYEPNEPLLALFQNLANLTRVVSRERVRTKRLDELEEVRETDYLKLDVQGAELDVIRGAPQTLKEVVVVQTEVEFVPMYRDQPLFAEVDQALRGAGFLFHRMLGFAGRMFKPVAAQNNPNAPGSQMLWSEAVYVKNFMELDNLPAEKLLKLGVILHVVFQSFDMAQFVLSRYDAKQGTGLQMEYIRRLTQPRPVGPHTSGPTSGGTPPRSRG
jgi:FkbM family methyltransferase